jgi:signal transduction histidine kinase
VSLSSRIIARLTVTALLATGAAYGWLYVKQRHVDSYLRERVLVRQAEDIASYLSIAADDSVQLDLPPQISEYYNSPGSRYRYAIRDESGRVVLSSGRHVGPLHDLVKTDRSRTYEYQSGEQDRTIGAAFRRTLGDHTLVTQVEQAAPMLESVNAAVLNEYFVDGGWLWIPFIVAILVVSACTVRRALAPLHQLSALAADINPGNSATRLPQADVPNEIVPLVQAVNSALDRLDEGLRIQREFNANAAHQLRTPLAVLSANIDTMGDKATAAKLRYDVDLMSRIVTQLLLVAKLETLDFHVDERVDLRAAAHEVAEDLGPLAVSTGRTLEIDEPAGPVLAAGNQFAVTAALGNLIENALSHTPAGGVVHIRVTAGATIDVEDSGPGVPPHLREKIFERFWKGDASKEGVGLGLSIVRRVMSALQGSVSVADAPLGGARFTLQFMPFDADGRSSAAVAG